MKQSLNQVQQQHDTRKYYYNFRIKCQVSRKQLFLKNIFFPEVFLWNYLKSCLPPNQALKPMSNEVFSQSQYAIHSQKKQKQTKQNKNKNNEVAVYNYVN